MTSYVFLWENPNGGRHWEAVEKGQTKAFLKKLLKDGIHPAMIMVAYAPILFHWVWPEFHKGLSDVNFHNINEEISGTEPMESNHKPVDIPVEKGRPENKYGWLAPDGRFFGCSYGGHADLADRITGYIQYISNPERHLEELGWAKVMSGSGTGRKYAIGMGLGKKLTNAQINKLHRMGLENAYGIPFLL